MRLLKKSPLACKSNACPGINEGQQLTHPIEISFSPQVSRSRDPEPGTCLVPFIPLLHSGVLIYMHIIFCKSHRPVVDCD